MFIQSYQNLICKQKQFDMQTKILYNTMWLYRPINGCKQRWRFSEQLS